MFISVINIRDISLFGETFNKLIHKLLMLKIVGGIRLNFKSELFSNKRLLCYQYPLLNIIIESKLN